MKNKRHRTTYHFILFDKDSPFRARKEVDRKKRGKRGYRKHKGKYT